VVHNSPMLTDWLASQAVELGALEDVLASPMADLGSPKAI